jgi:hypothetical protein
MYYFLVFIVIIIFVKYVGKRNLTAQFTKKDIYRIVFQSFETTHILKTTKNLETFKSRFELLKKYHNQLITYKSSPFFNDAFKKAVEDYRIKYYDKTLNGTIRDGLFEPQTFDLQYFFENTLLNCFKQSIYDDYKKMEELKTNKAKQNRLEKINIKIDTYLEYLESKGYEKEDVFYSELVKIREAE